jgi:multidrug efflux pump subunit AcrB
MLLVMAAGLFSVLQMRRELLPQFELGFVTVSIPYPGASPEEVEEGICLKIEEQIDGIDGIKKIRSAAYENVGAVVAEIEADADEQRVYNDIQNKVDQITTFPLEAEEPVISRFVFKTPAINVVVYGQTSETALRKLAEEIRDDLTATATISDASIAGARDYEISIEISETELRRYGLTFENVARAVSRASLDLPAGVLKTPSGEILLRAKGQRYTGREYEDIPLISLPSGAFIRLGQVATIIDGFEDVDRFSRYKGQPAVTVPVMKTGNEDVIEVAEATSSYVEHKRAELPEGIGIDTFGDSATMVRDRINLLLKNGSQGFVLVFLVLWLFLRWRLAFWVALGIPISFMGGFWVLHAQDATINMLSLFAFIMALGIVVDDAIIVGENIHAHHRRGSPPSRAAVEGAAEVGWPVVISVLTTIVAFSPLFFVSGIMGKFIAVIPLAVVATLAVSLVEAFLILPSHLKESLQKQDARGGLKQRASHVRQRIDQAVQNFIERRYLPFLKSALDRRYLTVALALGVLIISTGLITGGRIPFIVFPKMDSDYIFAKLIFPLGTPAPTTLAALEQVEEAAWKVEEEMNSRIVSNESLVSHMVTFLGEILRQNSEEGVKGGHVGQVYVELIKAESRTVSSVEFIEKWREAAGEIAGIEQLTFEEAEQGPGGAPVEIRLLGNSLEQLDQAAGELKEELAKFSGVFDIRDDFLRGKWELKVRAKPQAQTLGLTLNDIARQVRQAFYGDEAVRIQRGRDDIKVMVRYPAGDRRSRSNMERMRIRTAQYREVPLLEVADIDFGRGYSTIRRVNRKRAVTVTADVDENLANAEEIIADLSRVEGEGVSPGFLEILRDRHPGLSFDLEGQAAETRESVASLMNGFVYALIAIFCLLAAQFRSYAQPVIVMCAIPIAIIGAIWGHVLLGLSLTLMSLFGIVALSGVVVNDSLVLIDFINRSMRRGSGLREAVEYGGEARFRAIILTSATTIAGLAPMLAERSLQAQFLVYMAVSLAFGLAIATILTLVITPCLFLIVADVKSFFGFRIIRTANVEAGAPSSSET